MNIYINEENIEDILQVEHVITEAFGSREEADLVSALRDDSGWIPALSLVAKDEKGNIVGHALCTRSSIGTHPSLTLAPVAVLPEHQGKGIGCDLIKACIDIGRKMGEKTMTVLGHPGYYPRFGFEQASIYGVTCSLSAGPDEAKMIMALDETPIPGGEMGFCKPMSDAVKAYQPHDE
ncbi:putative N-acetyltransferase YhbS [Yokenella regensburgei]|uniref:N-acetyltransferase YhbS n=1 Tax=Yokenella regensburgei TaxID=158877 RepID=A0ABX9S074_9ENTR|nr:N-acetyltransferase [Yokenella regensburgei]RKR63916.1 putative N-acetyltransferase YhbS [Yokenella regensburgei]VFS24660.1 Predicted acetyltransferase [Yokenella regensburgei]